MVSVQEYLTTSYEADREYVDGELLERHSGEQSHARAHATVSFLLVQRKAQLGIRVLMSQRMRGLGLRSARSYRPPSAFTLRRGSMRRRHSMSVRYVWVIDPLTKQAFC